MNTRPDRKERRTEVAVKNQEARNNRSPQEQIEILDRRLGKGVGARKERARLQQQILDEVKAKRQAKEKKIKEKKGRK